MKRRSPTNSRKHENLTLRREYAERQFHDVCEFGRWLYPHFKRCAATEVHHVFGGTSGRTDLVTNLIRLSADAHRWCHEFPIDGRVSALWVKTAKDELDPDEFRTASGVHLEGWLLRAVPRHAWCGVLLSELREVYCD